MAVDDTLDQREKTYGSFKDHSALSQSLKSRMKCHQGWTKLQTDQEEALEMIQHKVARIINGDPNYTDSWHDIQGYAKLVEDRLLKDSANSTG
jgi:hypothetical protein